MSSCRQHCLRRRSSPSSTNRSISGSGTASGARGPIAGATPATTTTQRSHRPPVQPPHHGQSQPATVALTTCAQSGGACATSGALWGGRSILAVPLALAPRPRSGGPLPLLACPVGVAELLVQRREPLVQAGRLLVGDDRQLSGRASPLSLDPPKRLCAPAALAGRKPLAVAGRRIQKVHDLGSRNGPLTRGSAGA
jgi:hypothetical protein